MNSTDDEEGFHRSPIAEAILSLPAEKVLNPEKVKDPLSLRMNLRGALKNWEDVAALLGYKSDYILGDFAHHAYPGLRLLKDWIYTKKGVLRRLVEVFTELKLYSCLEVVHDCVTEYEAKLADETNNSGDSDDSQGNHRGIHEHCTDTLLSSEGSCMTGSCTMSSLTDYSSEQESFMLSEYSTTSSSGNHCVPTDSENEDYDSIHSGKTQPEAATSGKPPFLRGSSWSPPGTGPLDKEQNLLQTMDSERIFNRSISQPNDMKAKAGTDSKRKSVRKKLMRLFKKPKQHKKSPGHSSEKANSRVPVIMTDSSPDCPTPAVFTVSGTYREPAEKPCENLSPLKVQEARRSSLTDSLSSGESMSTPTSPGYESGYMSSEGPSVSSGKSISIIHCSDLEEGSFETDVLKLYNRFSELGYKCHLDKLEMLQIAEHKFRYALQRVQHSDFLFICVSPQLKKIFDSPVYEISDQLEDDSNCMLRLESDLILNELANYGSNRKGKFMTILLEGSSKSNVPCFLESFMMYRWPKDERKIRCIIEEQPEITPAPVSMLKTDPPSQVVTPARLIQCHKEQKSFICKTPC